jgi:hypothetical protein
MTLVSLNKLKKKGYVWDMQEDVLIHQTSGQKVCNIEEHYGLATIEFNPVEITDVAVEKIPPSLAKEDASELKENPPIVAEEDAPTEEKMNTEQKEDASTEEKKMDTMQKDDAPTLKKPDTDPVLAAVTVASGGEKLVNHKELNASVTPDSDWLKSAPDNPKWTDQKEGLIQSANGPKKRRSLVSKKRCKKKRLKIPKPLYGASKQQNQVLATNLNMASLKLVQLFQS